MALKTITSGTGDQTGEGGAPQAPPSSQAAGDDRQVQQQIMDMLKRRSQPRSQMDQPRLNPKMKNIGLGTDIGLSMLKMFVPAIGGAVQRSVKAKKEQQIYEAVNDYTSLFNAYNDSQIASGGDPQKANDMFMKDPRTQAIMGDKKKSKLIAKAFSVDLTNPGKSQDTAHFQGLKRFTDLQQARGQMEQTQKMMQQAKQNQQGQDQSQGQQPQQPQSQQAPQQPFPTHMTEPSTKELEEASATVKNIITAQAEAEPKTEFQAWYKAKKAEVGKVTPTMIEAHHNAERLKPIDQLTQQAIDQIQSGDTEGGQQTLELANNVAVATHPRAPNSWDLINKALKGDKEAKAMLNYKHNEDVELREAYGKGRSKYILKNFKMKDGSTRTMSELDFVEGRRQGLFGDGVIMINNLTTEQIGAIQRMQTEIGPKGTEFYNRGALKGLYDSIDVFDDTKTMAIFARAMSRAKYDSDVGQFIHNITGQLSEEHLDQKGFRALAYMNRLAESLGTLRRAGFLPSTEASQDLMYRLIPGGGTANSQQAKIELDNLNEMVVNATEIPMYTGKGTPEKKKMTLDEWLGKQK